MIDYKAARTKMVDNQIRTTDVTSHEVLDAFLTVPREEFVPAAVKPLAYIDNDIQLAPGRFLMEPSPLAKLIQLADIAPNDIVLEVGCGTGYLAALAAPIASAVVALEDDPDLAAKASAVLSELGMNTVAVVEGRE